MYGGFARGATWLSRNRSAERCGPPV
jgi:hypothetical protein